MDYTAPHQPPIGGYSTSAISPATYNPTPYPHPPPPHPPPPPPSRPRPNYIYKIHYRVSCSQTGARYHLIRTGPSYLITLQQAKSHVKQCHASWFENWWNECLEWAATHQFKRHSRR
ncbi:uncharacterized protein B0T23DRAFT_397197 [Neurospora hispaniola]|uniref:Uncharacterized protein n=1 Tax=Neurospora hispaniola TaxID=588809 RepID=A0AAJ0I6W1_9PEZI|nr:hypothetical protein B0T23DRAFT_397197 [Neurospora hispaniola]